MSRRGSSTASLAATSVLVLAACGGSGGPLSEAQLAAKVNAACISYAKASGAIPQPPDFVSNPAAAAAYLDKLRPLVVSEHTAIAGLVPAAGVQALFQRFVVASTHQLQLFESAEAKAHAHDSGDLRDIRAAFVYKQSVMLPMERTLGFTACER